MKKTLIMISIISIILLGCNKSIKPIKVTKIDFDLAKAETIMKRSWRPVHLMTNSKLETKPNRLISSKEEFFDLYDFGYIDDSRGMRSSIYETVVDIGEDGKEVRDNNGNLVFGEGNFINYIPTIYDKGIFIKEAYIKAYRYEEEYSFKDEEELIIEEKSNSKIDEHASGFHRTNIFRKNDKGEWVLYMIEGTMSIGWDR